jgi:LysM repeat protein
MKKIFSMLVAVFALTITFAQSNDPVQQYINTYKELAINEEIRTGVPAAITLAQGLLESDAGRSDLAIAANNHFGIKCKSDWTGDVMYHDDDLKNECFRSYPSAEASYRDHSDFLKNRPYYTSLFSLDPTDYKGWAYGLKKAGYATESDYAPALIKVIEDNNLEEYTLTALNRMKNGTQQDVAENNPSSNQDDNAYTLIDASTQTQQSAVNVEIVENKYPQSEFTINQTKVIFVQGGTSLFAIAQNHDIAYKKLLDFNELDNNTDILQKDQLIFLERKPKKSLNKEYHVVAPSETIEEIAQKEGVQLASLYEYNKMQKGLEPAAGEKIYLQPGTRSFFPKLLSTKNYTRK